MSAGRTNSEPAMTSGLRRPLLSNSPERCPDALDARHPAVLGHDPLRDHEGVDVDALFFGLDDLFLVGGHVLLLPPVEDRDGGRTQTEGRPGRVDGHIAAADHRHTALRLDRLLEGQIAQERHAVDDAFGLLTRECRASDPAWAPVAIRIALYPSRRAAPWSRPYPGPC